VVGPDRRLHGDVHRVPDSVSAYGLRRGYRVAWYATVVLLPVTAIQGLVQTSLLSYPLVGVSLVSLPFVLIHWRHFERPLNLTLTQLASLAAILAVQAYGTVGTYALREEFEGVNTALDAFYFTLVTASTVGYGDLTEPILESLGESAAVVVTRDTEQARRLQERGFEVVTGDPSDEDPLRRVHIERAAALIAATDDDAQDALSILTARELNPELRIVAAAIDRDNVPKLRRAGADTVLSPSVLGGRLLVESAFGNDDPERVIDELLGTGE
jgi:voltage-gated potassium channel